MSEELKEELKTVANVCSHCGNQFDWFGKEAFCTLCVESFEAVDDVALCEHCETSLSTDGKFCSKECEQADAFVAEQAEQESNYATYNCSICNVPYLADDSSDGVHCGSCVFLGRVQTAPVQTAAVQTATVQTARKAPCSFHASGKCTRGSNCPFEHVGKTTAVQTTVVQTARKAPCSFFARGKCTRGNSCPFEH